LPQLGEQVFFGGAADGRQDNIFGRPWLI
jgi:hypothetical protein